ncbi:hypothetical protein N7448_007753 [Penicillium atrosanguineum]|nr:hypothetical protein N7448_007753 [Penicillium atrosanguineum]
MGDGSDYPSPRSEAPHGATAASALASATETLSSIARMNESMSYIEGTRPRLSNAPPTFRRPCEWNKHMDKHDRPYKCFEPGCDKIQGFTYSGGLLRHQREVHKKNTDAKKPLMCPYTDCNRSTGNGFTRQENLREHLRLMVDLPWERANELEGLRANSLPATGIKRKHDSPNGDLPESDEAGPELHNEVKRLRREVQEKDRRLEELERIVAGLQQAIPQQPGHAESQSISLPPMPEPAAPQV